jgi:hypothetical protein
MTKPRISSQMPREFIFFETSYFATFISKIYFMELEIIQQKIHEIRGQKVMLDFDLAELYNVPTKVFKQAVKRNSKRFPTDFMFELNKTEFANLSSQIVTSSFRKSDGPLKTTLSN